MERRKIREIKKLKEQCEKVVTSRPKIEQGAWNTVNRRKRRGRLDEEHIKKGRVVFDFIRSNEKWVDKWILAEAMKGEDFYINRALFQIHSGSLGHKDNSSVKLQNSFSILSPVSSIQMRDSKTFKEVLLTDVSSSKVRGKQITSPRSRLNQNQEKNTVFVANIPLETLAKEAWAFFKRVGKVLDVILPRKRDKYGRRYGFVKCRNSLEASSFINKLNGKMFGKNKLRSDFALKKSSDKQKENVMDPSKVAHRKTEDRGDFGNHRSTRSHHAESNYLQPSSNTDSVKADGNVGCVDNPLQKELERSVMVETLEPHAVTDVLNQLDLLGYDNILVKGLSSFKFLLTFMDQLSFDRLDKDLLGLGFLQCKVPNIEDLLVPRTTWIQILGLPILAWNKETLNQLVGKWGKIVSITDKLNNDFFYKNPVVGLSTFCMEEVLEKVTLMVEGKNFKVQMKEIKYDEQFTGISNDYVRENCSDSEEDHPEVFEDDTSNATNDCAGEFEKEALNIEEIGKGAAELELEEETLKGKDDRGIVVTDIDSEFYTNGIMDQIWEPREHASSTSEEIVPKLVELSHYSNQTAEYAENSIGSVVPNLDKLKVFKKRGRPRKFHNKLVKAFQLPKYNKRKMVSRPEISMKCTLQPDVHKEAEEILESSTLMGH